MRTLMITTLILCLGMALPVAAAAKKAPPPTVYLSNSEDGARIHCPLDKIVWLNTGTHKYYFRSSKHYANSAHGGFGCLAEVKAAGNKRGDS
ncbi:MAG TPA: hypothetical protein VF651_06655 [Gammaproteobacteria bacterium]